MADDHVPATLEDPNPDSLNQQMRADGVPEDIIDNMNKDLSSGDNPPKDPDAIPPDDPDKGGPDKGAPNKGDPKDGPDINDLDIAGDLGTDKPDAKKPPEPDDIDKLTSDSIKDDDYPEAARANVGNLRKKISRYESVDKALADAGISYERNEDGGIELSLPEESGHKQTEELENKIKEKDDLLGRFDLQSTDGFKKKYIEPVNAHLKTIYNAALSLDPTGFDTDEKKQKLMNTVQHYARMDAVTRAAELQKNFPNEAATFLPLYTQVDLLRGDATTALENWESTKEKMSKEELAREQHESSAVKQELKNNVIKKLSDEGFYMLKKVSGTDERSQKWNAQVDQIHKQIDTFFGADATDPELAAEALVRGATAQVLLGVVQQYQKHTKDLSAKLKAHGVAEADLTPHTPKPDEKIPDDLTPEQAAKLAMKA